QLQDTNSFASRLRDILAVRTRHGIATSVQVDVPEVSSKAMLVMVHLLDTRQLQVTVLNFSSPTPAMVPLLDPRQLQVTVLNFSSQSIAGSVKSEHLPPGAAVIDMLTDR